MNEIASKANLILAFKAVKRNKGAPGVDNMTVKEVAENLDVILEKLSLAVIDRIVQQAVAQVLTKIYDPTFSNSSFGFRSKRSANMAIKASSRYTEEGKIWVVDIDLEQFFDKVNHDILMSKIAKTIKDKSLLRLIRRFLVAE